MTGDVAGLWNDCAHDDHRCGRRLRPRQPGPAGWAWYIDEDTWRAGGWPHGTNNMGELKAVLDLLEATAVDADQHLDRKSTR